MSPLLSNDGTCLSYFVNRHFPLHTSVGQNLALKNLMMEQGTVQFWRRRSFKLSLTIEAVIIIVYVLYCFLNMQNSSHSIILVLILGDCLENIVFFLRLVNNKCQQLPVKI